MQSKPVGKEFKMLLFLLLSGMKKFEYKGKQWHEECFCCMECKEPIRNKSFIPRDEQVVCVPCYEDKYAQRCTKCVGVSATKNVITRILNKEFILTLFFLMNCSIYINAISMD